MAYMISSTEAADRVVAGELRIHVADHLVGPVEQLHAVFLRHTHQPGDGLQRQLARHLFDEVAGTLRRGGLDDVPRALVQVVAQSLDRPWRECRGKRSCAGGCGAARPVEQDELAPLDLLTDRAVLVAGQRGLLQAGEDLAAHATPP